MVKTAIVNVVATAPYRASKKLYNFRTFQDIAALHNLIKTAEQLKRKFGLV